MSQWVHIDLNMSKYFRCFTDNVHSWAGRLKARGVVGALLSPSSEKDYMGNSDRRSLTLMCLGVQFGSRLTMRDFILNKLLVETRPSLSCQPSWSWPRLGIPRA